MAYVTYKELLDRAYGTQYVTYRSQITLSAKTGNQFTFADVGFQLQVGDIICQGIYGQTITNVNGTQITLDDATNINEGLATAYRSIKTLEEWNSLRLMAQQNIELYTGQWFESREFTGQNALSMEGTNTKALHFSVPIIDITSFKINNQTDEYNTDLYKVFNRNPFPDDRQNPKIELISNNIDIFAYSGSQAVFYAGMFNHIEGHFGYVEQDGSTPELIKWCTVKLALVYAASVTSTTSGLTVKREKTDIHEIEYETSQAASKSGNGTGDEDVDNILSKYKSPLAITGSDPLLSAIRAYYKTEL